jgi:quinolinate synthase
MIDLKEQILQLKRKKNAVILAHYYQSPEIQEVADYVGDSLGLSQRAAETEADIIVFAGVHFMAETAKILNPDKLVLLPDLNAGCSLAESCPPDLFSDFLNDKKDHVVITYVNCSAEIKAMSDIVCTSSNALDIVNSVPSDKPIVFAPDRNLGKYVMKQTGRNLVLWDGSCVVHEAFSLEKMKALKQQYPEAIIIAHPESQENLLSMADYVGSTSGMIKYVREHPNNIFIVATEAGILYEMKKEVPSATLIPAPAYENNSCACSECEYMKLNTMQKLFDCLVEQQPRINVSKEIITKALVPLQRMLSLS